MKTRTSVELFQQLKVDIDAIIGEMNARFREAGLPGETPFSTLASEFVRDFEAKAEPQDSNQIALPEDLRDITVVAMELFFKWTTLPDGLKIVVEGLAAAPDGFPALALDAVRMLAQHTLDKTVEDVRVLVAKLQIALEPHSVDFQSLKGSEFWPTEAVAPPEEG